MTDQERVAVGPERVAVGPDPGGQAVPNSQPVLPDLSLWRWPGSESGYLGVLSLPDGSFEMQFWADGIRQHSQVFSDLERAAAAYATRFVEHHSCLPHELYLNMEDDRAHIHRASAERQPQTCARPGLESRPEKPIKRIKVTDPSSGMRLKKGHGEFHIGDLAMLQGPVSYTHLTLPTKRIV
eukprot:TRINITY_DN6637_c0_g1_i3.p1 TRINITY_DN6637_c0_g1~~TRINITY_DN6637_c0_g1_i3.p1  ORF type:complete len:182 (-),score=24.21 TRINITY_DN6637_c0_g1_i3:127-672(-)